MKEISAKELDALRKSGKPFQLIDVREPEEAAICSLGGDLLPMGEVVHHLDRIKRDVPVVVHCRSGARSRAVIDALSTRYGFDNLINLKGGILAFGGEVDDSLVCE